MKPHGAHADSAHWEWNLEAGSDGVLVLRLAGRWLMHDHLPPRAAIERELSARPTARGLAFDTRSVEDWDSGFVVFVRQVLSVGRDRHLDADLSGLPAGVRKLLDQSVVPTVPAGLPSALLERRPDLRRAEQELVAANAKIGVPKADFFPQLSLTGLIGKASPALSALTAGTSTVWQAGGALTGPLFEGGKVYYNYKATQAAWEEVKWRYEQSVIQAFQEVSSSLAALDKLAGAEEEQIRSVKALEKSVQISRDRYLYGLSSYYEVLEAQQRLYPAQYAQAQIRLGRLVAYVQLYKALGGGWNLKDPQVPPSTAAAQEPAGCPEKKC